MALNDPFDFSGQGGNADIYRNLMMFGGALSTAANARDPRGFLTYGPGFAGPFGAAVQQTGLQSMETAQNRARLGYVGAQTRGQQLQNQAFEAELPLRQAQAQDRIRYLTDPEYRARVDREFQVGGGPSELSIGGFGNAPPPQTFAGGGQQGASAPSIIPIVQQVAKQHGIPEPLAIAMLQQESGLGTNPAANGNIGQITFKTAANPGYGMQPLAGTADIRDPAKNIAFSIEYLKKAGEAAGVKDWNDPSQWGIALRAYNGGGDPNYVANVSRYLPNGVQVASAGNVTSDAARPVGIPSQAAPQQGPQGQVQQQPGITMPPAVAQALERANQYEQMASQIERAKNMGRVVPGDPAAMRQAAGQWRAIATSAMTTAIQEQIQLQTAGPKADAARKAEQPYRLEQDGFRVGRSGALEFIPGGKADPAVVGAQKAAEARAQADNAITFDKSNNMYRGPNFLGRGPELREVYNPANGRYELQNVGELGPDGRPVTTPPITRPEASQEKFEQARAGKLAERFDQIDAEADAARDLNATFDNMRLTSQSWDLGKFAPFEGEARAWLKSVTQSFGAATPELDQKVADYTAFSALSKQLVAKIVRAQGAQTAVQEYRILEQAAPLPTNSREAFGLIADQWQSLNDYRIAKQRMAAKYEADNKQATFSRDFNEKVSPTSFLLNRMSQTPEGQRTMAAMIAKLQTTPEGKTALAKMRRDYAFAQKAELFDDLQPISPGGQ